MGLLMVLALTIPATAGLILLNKSIIRVIFEHGAFTGRDTIATAQALSLYSVGLFAYSSNKILIPAFYALDKTKYPVMASFLAIGMNLLLISLTIGRFQHLAIALSTSVTMILSFFFLITLLYLNMNGLPLRYLMHGCIKILFATVVMSGIVILVKTLMSGWFAGSLIERLCAVMVSIGVAACVYTILLHLLKLTELSEIIDKVRSKFSR